VRLYVNAVGKVFETYTYEEGMKRFKIFSDDLLKVFEYAEQQGFKPVLRQV
jgi:hypothetical protein